MQDTGREVEGGIGFEIVKNPWNAIKVISFYRAPLYNRYRIGNLRDEEEPIDARCRDTYQTGGR